MGGQLRQSSDSAQKEHAHLSTSKLHVQPICVENADLEAGFLLYGPYIAERLSEEDRGPVTLLARRISARSTFEESRRQASEAFHRLEVQLSVCH